VKVATMPRLKICCIQDEAEAALAVSVGADLLGLVGRGLSGPEVIDDDDRIAAIADAVPPGVVAVLLTREADPDALAAQVVRTRVGAVQICDAVPPAAWAAVRRAAPGVRILQVVHVGGPDALDDARAVAPHVDAVLLDSGTPQGATPAYGGTGKTHDWSISAAIVRAIDRPVFLAGGLTADNVAEAWATVRPFGLDLCTGVRTGGRLDPAKLTAYVAAARALR
jgi:phosphoribosylanthranilate isomerase